MTTAIELSALSMINDQQQLDIISNNLANADTPGFKRDVVLTHAFDQLLDRKTDSPSAQRAVGGNPLVPKIVRNTDLSPGALQYTGNPLDVAIEGDGYFELTGNQGVSYSRRGTFSIDGSGRLVDGNGLAVNGEGGEILLRGGEVTIGRDGTVKEDGEYAGRLKLVQFADSSALVKDGGGLLKAPAGSLAEPATDCGLRQGYREASNVKGADEMIGMLSVQRHFETAARVIKGYDEMVGTAISTIAVF
jgi:flagellar basal-body rod protein FlgF